eukprot:CAMPEP_0182421352 /NCGR_PEP_ID=MMETSP1167-20130531/6703_1 /TAXON_ID=2988 /ORGANISM="Mallomonas Sp, Strain CCMP3275" /LENGTH=874 /DNA_ID=CAMNT_0024598397 /DNA_START=395 /DNA_END=3022 /DNA_ORIENTATION=-
MTGAPVKTLYNPHKKGVVSLDISEDALYICALGAPNTESHQEVALWAWTRETDQPILRKQILSHEQQYLVRFDPLKQSEFCTTGPKTVCFWTWEELHLEGYIGKVSKTDFGHYSGRFSSTIYLSGTDAALTATDDGYVIVWETQYATVLLDDPADRLMRTASKVIRLVECGVTTMSVVNGYVLVGCADGTVRFYDYSLRLESWFEDMAAGPVTSVSFSVLPSPFLPGEGGAPGLQFWVPDFIVGTADAFIVGMESAIFQEVRVEDRRGTLLVQGMSDDISALACHPSRPLLAVSCYNGSLQVWDYDLKLLMNLREFVDKSSISYGATGKTSTANKILAGTKRGSTLAPDMMRGATLRPQCLAFDPTGELLAAGFTSGHVKLLRTDSFEDSSSYAPTPDTVVGVRFSPSGIYLAAYDSSHHILIFKRGLADGRLNADIDARYASSGGLGNTDDLGDIEDGSFVYLGRAKAHRAAITGIEFGVRDGREILISIGEDRRCVEFNLQQCSIRQGVVTADMPVRIELTSHPTAILWHPHIGSDSEDRFVVANDEFKLKEFNADSKQCRRTTLAPTFGGPPNRLLLLPESSSANDVTRYGHYVYSTADRVVGMGRLPLTGNPKKVMGLVAHPSRLSGLAISYDGAYLFTSGGSDLTTNMWAIDTELLYPAEPVDENTGELLPDPLQPFLDLLDGGEDGELHQDIVDYFYYSQLRSQGEDSMEARAIDGRVPLEELPSLMRAIGYYPTEEEITNMVNEVRYKYFMSTGETKNDSNLDEFIKLYINHRPAVPLSNLHIEAAFLEIKNSLNVSQGNTQQKDINWNELKSLLSTEGEAMSTSDFEMCMSALLGDTAAQLEGSVVTAGIFAEQVLGFEDFNNQES